LFIADTFQKEVQILKESKKHGLSVPKIIISQDNVLLLSYIPGRPLVDIINQTFNQSIIHSLAEWYYLFHSVHSLIKGDPRLRNFIIDDQTIFGLDFEEARDGHWILDVAGIAASLFDTDPIFDKRKQALAWHFLENYLTLKHSQRDSAIDQLYTETIVETLKKTARLRKDPRILDLANTITKDGF
jgi:tRNA A-37 threonylcarbamoyl transferase component Bud32